jgi:hypothetical protein
MQRPPFPSGLMPRFTSSRGPSLYRLLWFGRHPLALLLTMMTWMVAAVLLAGWALLVAAVWALWWAAVAVATIGRG